MNHKNLIPTPNPNLLPLAAADKNNLRMFDEFHEHCAHFVDEVGMNAGLMKTLAHLLNCYASDRRQYPDQYDDFNRVVQDVTWIMGFMSEFPHLYTKYRTLFLSQQSAV